MSHDEIPQLVSPPVDELNEINLWIHETSRPYIRGRTFELGSGTGLFSSLLIEHGIRTHLNEMNKTNQKTLIEKFKRFNELRGVYEMDLLQPDFEKEYAHLAGTYNSLVAVNIAEHGFYSNTEINNAKLLLVKGDCLTTIFPVFVLPYENMEIDQVNWKSYNNKFVKKLLKDFDILNGQYFKYPGHLSFLLIIIARKK